MTYRKEINVQRQRLTLIITICSLFCIDVFAQQVAAVGIIPEVRVNYGFVTSEKKVKPYIKDGYFPLFEFALTKETYGLERYEILYDYPRKGISFFYTDLGHKEYFGHAAGAIPFLNFPLIKDNKVFTWFRAGIGAAYFTKRFNSEGTIKDLSTGSKVNAVINLSPCMGYSPTKKMTFYGGVSFFHFTNAGLSNTPYFFNTFTGFLGWSVVIKKGEVTPQGETIARPRKKWKTTAMGAIGMRRVPTEPVKYFVPASASISATRWLTRKSRVGLTGDVFYDPSLPTRITLSYKPVPAGIVQLREGIALNYTWVVGSLELPVDFGVYLFPVYVSDGSFYNRYGIRYFPMKNYFFNLTVKSHFFKPDHLEAGMGIAF